MLLKDRQPFAFKDNIQHNPCQQVFRSRFLPRKTEKVTN